MTSKNAEAKPAEAKPEDDKRKPAVDLTPEAGPLVLLAQVRALAAANDLPVTADRDHEPQVFDLCDLCSVPRPTSGDDWQHAIEACALVLS